MYGAEKRFNLNYMTPYKRRKKKESCNKLVSYNSGLNALSEVNPPFPLSPGGFLCGLPRSTERRCSELRPRALISLLTVQS